MSHAAMQIYLGQHLVNQRLVAIGMGQICPSSIGPSLGPTCTKTLASNPRMTDNSPEMVAKISKIIFPNLSHISRNPFADEDALPRPNAVKSPK